LTLIPLTLFLLYMLFDISLYAYFVLTSICGGGFAPAVIALSYTSDLVAADKRSTAFGLILAAVSLAAIIGPPLGATLDDTLCFVISWVTVLIAMSYAVFILPESLTPENRKPFDAHQLSPVVTSKFLLSKPLYRRLSAITFLGTMVAMGTRNVNYLYMKSRFGLSSQENGFVALVWGLSEVFIQTVVLRLLSRRFREKIVFMIGLFASLLSMFFLCNYVGNVDDFSAPSGSCVEYADVPTHQCHYLKCRWS